MNNKYASSTHTASTSSVPEKYWKNQDEGYKEGFDWAVTKINERFIGWLLLGFLIGFIIANLMAQSIWLFLAFVALIILVDKVNKIEIKNDKRNRNGH